MALVGYDGDDSGATIISKMVSLLWGAIIDKAWSERCEG